MIYSKLHGFSESYTRCENTVLVIESFLNIANALATG